MTTINTIDASQRRAARVVGGLYLLLMASGVFAQIYAPGSLPGSEVTADSVRDVADHAQLLRLGAAVETLTFAGDAVLAVAYYVLLRNVSRGLAMLGAFWRLAQVAILTAYTLCTIVAVELATSQAFSTEQAAAMVQLVTGAHNVGYAIGFVFMGLGSMVFSYLLLRSRYVPRWLAGLGVVASALLATGGLVTIAFPEATSLVNPAMFAPMFVFEVTTGLWLLIRGVRPPQREASASWATSAA
ncbi:DUF4386 domain-containing protein [Dactylosporangium sp. NPDC049525]|uniref:DUF4386 domain-containing protein n=1 Tax=Dactylosporangium sp. NPDC049525 TaxID=3154730 RepID=UPI00341E36D0